MLRGPALMGEGGGVTHHFLHSLSACHYLCSKNNIRTNTQYTNSSSASILSVAFPYGVFPSMDQFRIIDKCKGLCWTQKRNKYSLIYLAVFSIRQPNLANLTHCQLFNIYIDIYNYY